ncbi:MAG: ywdK [Panacagrimonas sp.]|jgi:uncharacterized membrane protein YgdD (TMEM256/DUF423 family)|nr:DUF423 domain-containing protein [Panacagrimonas sp.]MCC2655979.1 ywdK [Panacagrimonas sp.]
MTASGAAAVGIAAISGFIAVALGAFGAHALRARLSPEMLAIWKTANEYHFYHALALLLVGVLARQAPTTNYGVPAACFLFGTLVFSGSLYVLALTGMRWLGAITPIGGLLFLAGWAWLAWIALRS